ncbi:putative DNA-binding domain protein [compost metagenome]
MSLQGIFSAALLAPEHSEVFDCFSSPAPASRFAVYRNNVISALLRALADSYPVTVQLVGPAFFDTMALAYIQAHPPRSRLLVDYGDNLADFIDTFGPAASLPYLGDMARLERLRVRAYHSADRAAVSLAALAELMAQPERLATLRLGLHPCLSILRSDYAVCSLWQAHQEGGCIASVNPYQPENAMVLRLGLDVELLAGGNSTLAFIQALLDGLPLGQAAHLGSTTDGNFDLGQCLALLISKAVITHLLTDEKARQ